MARRIRSAVDKTGCLLSGVVVRSLGGRQLGNAGSNTSSATRSDPIRTRTAAQDLLFCVLNVKRRSAKCKNCTEASTANLWRYSALTQKPQQSEAAEPRSAASSAFILQAAFRLRSPCSCGPLSPSDWFSGISCLRGPNFWLSGPLHRLQESALWTDLQARCEACQIAFTHFAKLLPVTAISSSTRRLPRLPVDP